MVGKVWYPKGLEGKEEFKLTEEDTPYQGRIYTLYKGEEVSEAEFPVEGWTRQEKEEYLEELTGKLYSLLGTTITKTALLKYEDGKYKKIKDVVIISEPPENDFRGWYRARAAVLSEAVVEETISERFPLLKIEETYRDGGREIHIKTDDEKLILRIGRLPYHSSGCVPNEYAICRIRAGYYQPLEEPGEYDLDNPSHVEFFKYLAEASKYLPILPPNEPPEVSPEDAQLPIEEVDQAELCDAILKLLQSKNNK